MVKNYQLGKIYKIEVIGGDNESPIYIGSTNKDAIKAKQNAYHQANKLIKPI